MHIGPDSIVQWHDTELAGAIVLLVQTGSPGPDHGYWPTRGASVWLIVDLVSAGAS